MVPRRRCRFLSRWKIQEATSIFLATAACAPGSMSRIGNSFAPESGGRGYAVERLATGSRLLQTLMLTAVRLGDAETGKGLRRKAIAIYPQQFEVTLRALDRT